MQVRHAADVYGFAGDGQPHSAGTHVYHTHSRHEEKARLIIYNIISKTIISKTNHGHALDELGQ